MRSLCRLRVPLLGVPEFAQPPLVLFRPRVQFRSPIGLACLSVPMDRNEDDHNSVFWLIHL